MSDHLIYKVQEELEIQDPICDMINILQKKDTNIADGADLWLKLEIPSHVTDYERSSYMKRKEMALSEVALAAFYLDPFKVVALLSSNQRSAARCFISSKLRGNLVNELLDFEKETCTKISLRSAVSSSIDFWTFGEVHWPNLAKIAYKLLRIPASTAQLERVFSMWQHIHTNLRNRITFERSKKLMHIYYYFNQLNDGILKNLNL